MFNFDTIIGNEQIKKNLQSAVTLGKVSHAYIINGGEGTGKKLIANTFAKTILCENGGANPCGVCSSCKSFESGNNPDVFYIKTEKKSIGVKEVREQIVDVVDIKPYKYKYKVFIMENADLMTVAAQNAILKTLEEPPSYGVFLLLSSNTESFLQTILSRCVVLKIRPLTNLQVSRYLIEKEGVEQDKADVFTEYAQGSIGKAVEMAKSEEFSVMRDNVINWFTSVNRKDITGVMALAEEMKVYKDDKTFLDIAYLWYRDLLAYKKTDTTEFVIQKDKALKIKEESRKLDEIKILGSIDAIWNCKKQLMQNANFQMAAEVMLLKIKG